MNNRQATGYMLMACKSVGMPREQVIKLFAEMYYFLSVCTEDEAEEKGHEWYRSLLEDDEF